MTDKERSQAIADYATKQIGGPYVYGATAEKCTPGMRRQQMQQYEEYADKIAGYCPVLSGKQEICEGCDLHGLLAYDCATLVRFSAKAAGLKLPSGATSQWQDGDWIAKGLIGTLPLHTVCILYHRKSGSDTIMSHTGVYLGNGMVADARGHEDGVKHSHVNDYPWTHWAILRGMECPEGLPMLVDRPTLRKGSSGNDVRELQRLLRSNGYVLEIDGKFGEITRQAVLSYQATRGLERDGVVGMMTWAALYTPGQRYTVTVRGLAEAPAREIVDKYGGEMEPEGVSKNG